MHGPGALADADATSPRRSSRGWRERLVEPVDIASLVMARVFFGLLMLWMVIRYFGKGWIGKYWIEPEFNFGYFGLDWVAPWPGDGMYWHFLALGALAVLIVFGLLYRLAAALFFLGFTYVFLLEQARYLNHAYLVCLVGFLMAVVPAHGRRSCLVPVAGAFSDRRGLFLRRRCQDQRRLAGR